MTRKLTLTKLNIFITAAAVLLVLGLAVEGMLTKPHQKVITDQLAQKSHLQSEIERQRLIESDSRTVAGLLGVESLTELENRAGDDAISYFNELLEESKLVRLGLTTSGQADIGSLQVTSYTLRAKGEFGQLQNFVQKVENGDRLASIDAFRIMPTLDEKSLEGRFNLSIYDVKEER